MADFDPAPKYKYSPDGKTVTWVNRDHMPKVAAQDGDEPMRAAAAVIKLCQEWCVAMYQHAANIGAGGPGIEAALDAKAESAKAAIRSLAVSPRATADVERDAARWRFFKEHAQDVYQGKRVCEWIGFSGVMEHGSRDAAIDFLAAIATTKPGA